MFRKRLKEQIAEELHPELYNIGEGETVFFQGQSVLNYFNLRYADYVTNAPLLSLWSMFLELHRADIYRAYLASRESYSPLSNYDKHETDIKLSDNGKTTVTNDMGKDGVSQETQATSTESQTLRDVSKVTNKGETTTTTEREDALLTYDGVSYQAHDVEVHKNTTTGNIGVTTSQQMLESEYELRLKSVMQLFLDMFITEYAYFVWDGDECYDY